MKVYNALALPILLRGSENWILKNNYKKIDHKRNRINFRGVPFNEKQRRYKPNWGTTCNTNEQQQVAKNIA